MLRYSLTLTTVCLLASTLAFPFDIALNDEWDAFKITHRKQYIEKDEPLRRMVWEKNVGYISQHNLEADRGVHTYSLGMNEYGDMTSEEFAATMNGYRHNVTARGSCFAFQPPMNVQIEDLPESVDWRDQGYVTKVKNQGTCGSCWAFSATGSLEGQHARKYGQLVSLSEKNLMDCSKPQGNNGCGGGLMDQAFAYVIKNNGLDTEESYPYQPKNGKCEFNPNTVGTTEESCVDIKVGSEEDLKAAVATVGPISVAIDAGHKSFQLYKSGIYNEKKCSSKRLDHGVLAVGYGSDKQDYWLVKNSWGETWGMDGYIKMSRNHDNQCGIATQASFPIV